MEKVKVDTIIFDFDSTILRGELLEILAEIKLEGHPLKRILMERIKDITNQGMSGQISFYESLSRRLQLLNLDEATITRAMPIITNLVNTEYLELLPKISDKKVYIISGGYSNILHQMSDQLQISQQDIFAIKLNFSQGVFSNLDPSEPLIQSDGKAIVAKNIKNKGKTLMVGDGMTDYQVKLSGASDYFVAYKGIVERQEVCQSADFVIDDLRLLSSILL